MPNAIALNSSQFNLSRVLGPGAGVAIVSTIGLAACFAVNALSFFFVVVALSALHLPPHMPSPDRRALVAEEWLLPEPLKVRMGLHTGIAELREGDYYGTSVNRAAPSR